MYDAAVGPAVPSVTGITYPHNPPHLLPGGSREIGEPPRFLKAPAALSIYKFGVSFSGVFAT
jgi:hypothetical protein